MQKESSDTLAEGQTRVYHLNHLAEMVGDECGVEMAEAMRDTLIEAGALVWTSNSDGGMLEAISASEWERLVDVAMAS